MKKLLLILLCLPLIGLAKERAEIVTQENQGNLRSY